MTTFTIPGQPYAKKRPRFSRKSGRAYDPKENSSFERVVGTYASQAIPEPLTGPVRVTIRATFVPAASWSKKKTAEHLHRPHTQKPDTDNIGKAVMDGLNRIAFVDDAQIADLQIRKVWGITAQTVITVEAI